VSKKTIAFTMPAPAPRAREGGSVGAEPASAAPPRSAVPTRSDDWVRDRESGPEAPARPDYAAAPARVVLDLSAERTLIEVLSLSFLVPFALGWFWVVNALAGRLRP
jgi:hypothetical protein